MSVIKRCFKSEEFDKTYNAIWQIGTGGLYVLSLESYKETALPEKRPAVLFYGDAVQKGLIEYIGTYGRFIRGNGSHIRNGCKEKTQQTSLHQVLAALYYGYDVSRAKLLDVHRKMHQPITIRADVTDKDGHKLSNAKLHRFLSTHKLYDMTPGNLIVNSADCAAFIHSQGFLFDGRLTVGNQEFFFPYGDTADRNYNTSHDFLDILANVKGWHIGASGAECDLDGVKNAHLSIAHLVALYWGGDLDSLLEQYKIGKLAGQELLLKANDLKNLRTKNRLVIDHFAENKSYNLPHALAWSDMATNSAFKTGRTAIRAPYFFHMAHDYRHGKIKVVCGIKDKQEYRFIFDADDLTKPPQNKEKSLPDNEACQCLECFREFSKAVHKTKEPGRENLLAKSINRQIEHMRRGVHTLPDELEDISEMPHESFREYAEGVLENMVIA